MGKYAKHVLGMEEIIQISIIIPTRNRAETLHLTLESILHQTLDKRFYEVIVCDNNSIDYTEEIVNSYKPGICQDFDPWAACGKKSWSSDGKS